MKKVLFACIENSCRSQMAEGFAHIHGTNVLMPLKLECNSSIEAETEQILLQNQLPFFRNGAVNLRSAPHELHSKNESLIMSFTFKKNFKLFPKK